MRLCPLFTCHPCEMIQWTLSTVLLSRIVGFSAESLDPFHRGHCPTTGKLPALSGIAGATRSSSNYRHKFTSQITAQIVRGINCSIYYCYARKSVDTTGSAVAREASAVAAQNGLRRLRDILSQYPIATAERNT